MNCEHFRLKLAEIASKIEKEKLERLKFLCKDFIPDGDREKISSPEQLFIELEHRRKLAPHRLKFLRQCLKQVARDDLADELKTLKHLGEEGFTQPPTQFFSPPAKRTEALPIVVGEKEVICDLQRWDNLVHGDFQMLLDATGNFKERKKAGKYLRSMANDLDRVWKVCKVGSAIGSCAEILGGLLAAGGEVATFMWPDATTPLLTTSAAFGVTGSLANLGLKTAEVFTTSAVMNSSDHALEDAKVANEVKQIKSLLTTDEKVRDRLTVLTVHVLRVFGATHLAAMLLEDSLTPKVHFLDKYSVGIITAFLIWDTSYLALTVSDIITARGSTAGRYLRDAADDLEAYDPEEYRDVSCARFF